MSKGQVSIEFIVLFLALLVAVVVSTMTPGIFGLNKSVELSSASLAHAALSKVKSNIELLSVSGEGSYKMVYVKSPPANWTFENRTIRVVGNGFNISTNTSIDLDDYERGVPTLKILSVNLTRNDNNVKITIN
uniref:Class III signal peptide n=1 Tax=Methanococcus maripaludis (strain C6 / ATCC BAA-1332) TaxID=444158 RepID=A9A861_METM6